VHTQKHFYTAVSVIVEYVATNHNPNALTENRKIEQDLGLDMGTLVLMRWIKPIQGHMAGQCTTHLIAWFQSMGATSCVIWNEIVIAGKRAWER